MGKKFILFSLAIWGLVSASLATQEADFILVEKAKRKMTLYAKEAKIKEYKIALGENPVGHKQQEGDERVRHSAATPTLWVRR